MYIVLADLCPLLQTAKSNGKASSPTVPRRQLLTGMAAGSASFLVMPMPGLANHQHNTVVLPGALLAETGPDCTRTGITPAASTTRLRRSVTKLGDTELLLLRKGVEEMKKRDVEDKTSWQFQANIHGFNRMSNDPELWDKCEHQSREFLAW
jgi:hypothetical protein